MKPRIAIWIHGGLGGGPFAQGQPALQRLIYQLADKFEIDAYVHAPPGNDFKPENFGIISPRRNSRWGSLNWFYLIYAFIRNHSQKRYDVFYAFWGYPAGVIAVIMSKIFRRPAIIHLQGGDSISLPSHAYGVFYHPWRRMLCTWAYKQCSCLIALTHYQVAFLRQYNISRNVEIIPFGVDATLFTFQAERSNDDVLCCLHIGNLTPIKDQETMLKTFALLAQQRRASLVIIGFDFYDGRLQKISTELGIEKSVQFLGLKEYTALPRYYHEADVFLHTPLYEGQGLVFAEAAACGTVIAGTRVGMLSDMGDECGIIVTRGEHKELAAKIIETFKSPGKVESIRKCAMDWATSKDEVFTKNEIIKRIESLLNP